MNAANKTAAQERIDAALDDLNSFANSLANPPASPPEPEPTVIVVETDKDPTKLSYPERGRNRWW